MTVPLYKVISESPENGTAHWVVTSDDVRLRVGLWNRGNNGTILLFPGRAEFIEKYGRVAGDFQDRGFAVAVIDWRGQGLSDRLVPNRHIGYVGDFADYQLDVAALIKLAEEQNLPKPWYLCAHSMGGTIGLRALHNKLPVKRAVFLAPMWGLMIDPIMRPIIQALAAGSKTVGLGVEFSPGTGPDNYIATAPFEDNVLTSDPEVFAYLKRQLVSNPGLALGGPSIHWLYEALTETRALGKLDAPDYKILCMLGNNESVVDKRDVLSHMIDWPDSRLELIRGARHEILMETPSIQKMALEIISTFLTAPK